MSILVDITQNLFRCHARTPKRRKLCATAAQKSPKPLVAYATSLEAIESLGLVEKVQVRHNRTLPVPFTKGLKQAIARMVALILTMLIL